MHLKSTNESAKSDAASKKKSTTTTTSRIMAAVNDDDNYSRLSNSNNNNNNNNKNNNNNNNNNDDNNSTNNTQMDEAEIKLKKQTLEQRKQELEKLLNEKSWLLQQIQKQETQILNGNLEYLNINEIFAMLAQQYKQQEQVGVGSGGGTSAILRRKTASKENHINNSAQNNNNNRQSEISNRSSEYDNYPGGGGGGGGGGETHSIGGGVGVGIGVGVAVATQQLPSKNATALKKRVTPTPTPTANINYVQLQRQQQLLQQQYQYAAMAQQQQQQKLLQHAHFHQQPEQQQQQQQKQQQRHYLTQPLQIDAISLYSVNSTNVATLRQQHISPQQQPIVVQCDKYYLSPTHQSYNDGGFILSSQNIKKYISPMSSPTKVHPYDIDQQQHQQHQHQQPIHQHLVPLQQLPMHTLHPQSRHHQLDAISLAPSYVSVDMDAGGQNTHNIRWRSQTSIPPHLSPQHHQQKQDIKSHSSDMLAQIQSTSSSSTMNYYSSPVLQPPPPPLPPPSVAVSKQSKPLDEISISSVSSETQKKSKPKQWLESSLDGPVIRSQSAAIDSHGVDMISNVSASVRLPTHTKSHHHSHHGLRERGAKLSSQSMSSGRHYSMSAQKSPHTSASKLLQDDDGRYAKLSQSTSYLNTMADPPQVSTSSISPAYHLDATPIDITQVFRYLPPKPSALVANSSTQPTPPPRPPPFTDKLTVVTSPQQIVPIVPAAIGVTSSLSPEIRIESPQNMTIVQQATFQPYKEETKPFEMSDFYKYSTKFRQKETASAAATNQMDH